MRALLLILLSLPASGVASEFQAALDAAREQFGFPGATAAYVLSDGSVGVAATGLADLEAGTPMTVHSRMLAGSIGKTFVAMTSLALAREGVLDLDAPVLDWLGDRPWYARLANHDTITLRHLLTHTSGLPDHVHLEDFVHEVARRWSEPGNPFPPDVLIGFILDQPPLFMPGQGWAYTDTGYILVGLVLEQATGRRYYDEIQQRFLQPLGLTSTGPADRRELPRLVPGYMAPNPFGFPTRTTTTEGVMTWHPGLEWTGGGLISHSLDLAHWGAALFGGGALSGDYVDALLDSVPVSPGNLAIRYGLGVAICATGPDGPVYGHGGWVPGYSSSLRHYVDHGVTIAFQINTDIGVLDDGANLMAEIEGRLLRAVLSTVRGNPGSCRSGVPRPGPGRAADPSCARFIALSPLKRGQHESHLRTTDPLRNTCTLGTQHPAMAVLGGSGHDPDLSRPVPAPAGR